MGGEVVKERPQEEEQRWPETWVRRVPIESHVTESIAFWAQAAYLASAGAEDPAAVHAFATCLAVRFTNYSFVACSLILNP